MATAPGPPDRSNGRLDAEGEPLLLVEALRKHFPLRRGPFSRVYGHLRAVDGVSFLIRKGETLGLVGESGSGKTTVGRCVLRLTEPTSGRIVFDGLDLLSLDERSLRRLRRRMQVVFQDPEASLNPRMMVRTIVGEPLAIHGLGDGPRREARVAELLNTVGLDPQCMDRYPHEFSGGQRQRIGLARALAVGPELIICDEPVSALDVSVQAQIINLLASLQNEMGLSYLFIAHELSVVRRIAGRVAVMYLGRIVETGPVSRLFEDPRHPYTKALLSAAPRTEPGGGRQRIVLKGDPPSAADPPSGCRFRTRCPVAIADCSRIDPALEDLGDGREAACLLAR